VKPALIQEPSDEQLLTAAGRGEIAKFRALMDRHAPAVHRVVYRMLGDINEAEDVTQEAFLRLWRQSGGWQSSGAGVPAWLRRVGTNLSLDRLRRRGRFDGPMPEDIVDHQPSAPSLLDQATLLAFADRALMALPAGQRAAVVLTYYEELANSEAAEIMGMKVKAFESLLLRGRRALRKHVEHAGLTVADLESWQ
jgi:RNA polymerase sigma factor (sigma-70 family)